MINDTLIRASIRADEALARASSSLCCRPRRRHRRGVLLLVVLSILVLFVVIAVTFVLIAGQARRSLRAEATVERYTNDPQRQLDEAAYQAFRGSDNVQSAIYTHSVLEDMYGSWIEGYLPAAPPVPFPRLVTADNSTGQLIDLYVQAVDQGAGASQYSPATTGPFSLLAGYYNGQVLTMTSGPARGLSTRIVGYTSGYVDSSGNLHIDSTGNSGTFRVMAFDGLLTSTFITWYTNNTGFSQRVIINGRAFNGTGVGLDTIHYYNPTSGGSPPPTPISQLTAADTSGSFGGTNVPYVYLPNPKYFTANATYNNPANPFPLLNYSTPVGPGGANEDYDAPDVQNMFLAWVPVQSVNPFGGALATTFPSFHRPDLAAWYANNSSPYNSLWTNPNSGIHRKVILRPLGPTVLGGGATLPGDHPLFTGSNSNPTNPGFFDPIHGPWDVDNDGDGTFDSVWVDVGFPVQTAADGKTYKPLAAYLIVDLDGRVNVNAHGNGAQAFAADSNNDMLNVSQAQGPLAMSTPGASGPLQNTAQLPRGQGAGPAEINPGVGLGAGGGTNPIFQNGIASYQHLLYGWNGGGASIDFDGRHGELPLLTGTTYPLPGYTNSAATSFSTSDDVLAAIKHYDIPQNWYAAPTYISTGGGNSATTIGYSNLTSYGGEPPDLMGRLAIGLDYRGQPIYCMPATAASGTTYLYGPLLQGAGGLPSYESPLGTVTPAVYFDVPHSPYALNLSQRNIRPAGTDTATTGNPDNAYTLGELERILRRMDVDAFTLPDRLRYILEGGPAATATPNALLRQLITTDSYDVPSPSVVAPTELRTTIQSNANQIGGGTIDYPNAWVNLNVADLLAARLVAGGNGAFNTSMNFSGAMASINVQLTKMLPPEVVAGQYLDLNRPFGNGRDDTINQGAFGGSPLPAGNGSNSLGAFVVDEPQEYATNTAEPSNTTVTEAGWSNASGSAVSGLFPNTSSTGVPFNLINSVDFNQDTYFTSPAVPINLTAPYNNPQLYARQLYARYLYVMMMTLMDQNFKDANWISSPPAMPYPNDLTARRVAQWAINAVDYRDADAIMTPFEYDANPFNGWDVDGIVETADASTDRRIVWGCEAPELVLTEAIATHDRRVRDSTLDTTSTSNHYRFDSMGNLQDPTLDQMRIPQGSLFVEMYCPRGNSANATGTGGSQAVYPGELYTYTSAGGGTAQWYLNLGAMSPPDSRSFQNPVWRLAVTSSVMQNANNNVQQQFTNQPQSTLDPPLDPYNNTILATTTNTNGVTIERLAWFGTTPPNTSDTVHLNCTYYNRGTGTNNTALGSQNPAKAGTTQVLLQPGGYAVVGPRAYTNFGRVGSANSATYPYPNSSTLSPQQIALLPQNNQTANSSVAYIDATGTANSIYAAGSGKIQPPMAIICAAAPPTSGTYAGTVNAWKQVPASALLDSNNNTGIGLSVSEPLFSDPNYYLEPTVTDQGIKSTTFSTANMPANWMPSTYYTSLKDAYGAETPAQVYPDMPYENSQHATTSITLPAPASVTTASYPLNVDSLWKTQTTPTPYRYVLLQRLANPLLPFNPPANDPLEGSLNVSTLPLNPYITVDWLPVYLTVFNGEILQANSPNQGQGPTAGQPVDPDDINYMAAPPFPPLTYGSLQRGPTMNGNNTDLNLYSTNSSLYPSLTPVSNIGNSVVFDYSLDNNIATLGYLNQQFFGRAAVQPWSSSDTPNAPQQYWGEPNPAKWPVGTNGSNITFPWINWPNRPFVNHFELTQVPASSPTRLYYDVGNSITNAGSWNTTPVYGSGSNPDTTTPLMPFEHLLNFAQTTATNAPESAGVAPHFYRLFEYVRVPSRFIGTETMLNPNSFMAAVNPMSAPADHVNEQAMFSYLHPPFNKVSRYRDPGRVNINTLPHLSGSVGGTVTTDPKPVVWNAVQDTPLAPGTPNPGLTTTTAGPTWSQVAMSIQQGTTGTSWSPGLTPTMFNYPFRSFAGAAYSLPISGVLPRGIDVTFMRPDPKTPNLMLFDFPAPQVGVGAASYQGYNAPDRNSYFRYQNLASIANTLTTRSNVYAVWVTMGYFQVQPVATGPSQVYPDGYQLCDELGSDTGNVTRHRAFYIFDRTVPVAFERGMNHNVDRAILLRRYIE